ncbi:hypothetical protein B0H34DRAFT_802575 [Crassisporium funariophilum]|nr:hypothetical protein B0H34DRAFT_802575 [Crassisporium funariophilum]
MNLRFIRRSQGPPPLRRQKCRPLPQQGSGLRGGLHALRARVSGLVSQFRKPNNALGLFTSPADPLPVLLVTKTTEYATNYLGEKFAQSDLGLNLHSNIIVPIAVLSQSTDERPLSALSIFNTDHSNELTIESEGELTPSADAGQPSSPSMSGALRHNMHNLDPYMPRPFSNLDDSITSISTYAISISECLAILHCFPNLESATFRISSIGEILTEDVNPQSLTSLSITSSINVGTLFNCLTIPSLEELELRYELNGLDHFHELRRFVERSRCTVKKLTLIGSNFSTRAFNEFIVDASEGLEELILGKTSKRQHNNPKHCRHTLR